MVYAGTNATSFRQASEDLQEEAEMAISEQRIMRATKRIGEERIEQRESEIEAWEQLALPEQQGSPAEQVPAVAVVEMDGGRLQIRERKPSAEEEKHSSHWREMKVGCLLSSGQRESSRKTLVRSSPASFCIRGGCAIWCGKSRVFASRRRRNRSMTRRPSSRGEGQPEVLVRSVVATRQDVHALGRQLAAAAWQRGFAAAPRKAFVGDGQEANWTVHRTQFSHYVPILDFIHATLLRVRRRLGRATAATRAGRSIANGRSGFGADKCERVIEAWQIRQQELGLPEANESEESPRQKVADALRYLQNQKSRMHYDEYRRQGLPLTSSHIESTIKQINRRVKGTEKFWSGRGAEALLQLAADYLSETKPLTTFWRERPSRATGQRCYQTAS